MFSSTVLAIKAVESVKAHEKLQDGTLLTLLMSFSEPLQLFSIENLNQTKCLEDAVSGAGFDLTPSSHSMGLVLIE